jgi:hypothetical protein
MLNAFTFTSDDKQCSMQELQPTGSVSQEAKLQQITTACPQVSTASSCA